MLNNDVAAFDIQSLLSEKELQQETYCCFFRKTEKGFEKIDNADGFLQADYYDVAFSFEGMNEFLAFSKNGKVIDHLHNYYPKRILKPFPSEKAKAINDFVNQCLCAPIN